MRNMLKIASLLAFTLIVQAERTSAIDYLISGSVIELASIPDQEELALPELREEQIGIGQRDGKWVMTLRLSSPGAGGMQFLLQDLHLTSGSELFLYEMNAGERGALRGSYRGSGPLEGDPFWSDPVFGQESLLEVVFAQEAESSLPFHLAAARVLNPAEVLRITSRDVESTDAKSALARPELEGTSGMAKFRGATVPFTVREGIGVLEGDILLGPVEELVLVSGKEKAQREGMGITSTLYRWSGGVIPYVIDAAMPNTSRITDAVSHWNTLLGGAIQLTPRTSESYYLKFTVPASAGTCSSYIGNIRMANQPVNIGDYCSTGNVIHEIGHAVGLFHEQSREDRDQKVQIQWANITVGYENNFAQSISTSDDLGAYDYGSIMHYGASAFSSNGLPTIVTIPAGIAIGQRSGLSSGDISSAKLMYPATQPPPAPTTVAVGFAVNLSGPQLVIDGATVTAPVTYQWTVGSVHTVNAPNLTLGSTRYLFSRWSDNGAQSHSVTTPSTNATFTAYFSRQFKVTAASSNTSLGSVSSSPTSSDAFYNEGSSLSVSGSAAASACLTSWSGISAPPSSPVQVNVNQTYSIVGNFQTGAVSVSPSAVSLSNSAQTYSLTVTSSSGCSWSASEAFSWISIVSGGGSSSGVLQFSVSKNNSKSSRSGSIKVGALTVSVQQAGR
ncbi:MAG: M12 family metallopeptidase [Acidobacteriia bacterium]|nr:M12 family metallopeptidase [Terriglobia bacterium]